MVQAYLDADVTNDFSQQSIGDCVILTGDMFDGCGILRNVSQMSLVGVQTRV